MPLSRPSLLADLTAAAAEGLEPNLRRFLAFLGWREGEVLEAQVLQVPRSRSPWREGGSYVAHLDELSALVELVEQAQQWRGEDGATVAGAFLLLNRVSPAVAARYPTNGRWHRMTEGTSDSDILARRALYIDLDAVRAKGTSATDAHLARTFERAAQLRQLLAKHALAEALGVGHSGNGAALFVALDDLPCSDATDRLVRAALLACKHLAGDPGADDKMRDEARQLVGIDVSVSDRKRLCPAFGSLKRKGGELPDRPHRRTAFVGPPEPRRLDLAQLRALVEGLQGELPEPARAEVARALADPKAKTPLPPRASTGRAWGSEASPPSAPEGLDAFRVANHELDVLDVLGRLGLVEGDRPVCPGCRRSSQAGGMVEVLGNGLKCSSGTCASAGPAGYPGFRSVVDLVMAAQGLDPAGALGWLRAEFPSAGLEPPSYLGPRSAPRAPAPPAAEPRAGEAAAPVRLGDWRWLGERAWPERPPPRRWLLTRPPETAEEKAAGSLACGFLPLGKVGMLAAAGGAGKTMALVQLAVSVVTGRDWLGYYSVPADSRGPVLLALAEEDEEEVQRRIFEARRGLTPEQQAALDRWLLPLPLAGTSVALLAGERSAGGVVVERGSAILDTLRDRLNAASVDWRLLVLDPLSRWAGPETETDNAAATRFVAAVETLATQVQGRPTVLLAHHTSKAARIGDSPTDATAARGASGLTDGVRWVATLSPLTLSATETVPALSLVKSNYSPPAERRPLKREVGGVLRVLKEAELRRAAPPPKRVRQARPAEPPSHPPSFTFDPSELDDDFG